MNLDLLKRLQQNIHTLETQNGKKFVFEGKFVTPGLGNAPNIVSGTKIFPTRKEALINQQFEDSILGKLDKGEDEPDLTDEEIDDICIKYVERLVEQVFKGFKGI